VRQIGRRNYSIGDDEVDGGPCGEEGIDGRKGVDEGTPMSQSDWQTQKLRNG
jgi:hypothetical protein